MSQYKEHCKTTVAGIDFDELAAMLSGPAEYWQLFEENSDLTCYNGIHGYLTHDFGRTCYLCYFGGR